MKVSVKKMLCLVLLCVNLPSPVWAADVKYHTEESALVKQVELMDNKVELVLDSSQIQKNMTQYQRFYSFNSQAMTRLTAKTNSVEDIKKNQEKYGLDFAKVVQQATAQGGAMLQDGLDNVRAEMQGVFLFVDEQGAVHVLINKAEMTDVDGNKIVKVLGDTVLRLENWSDTGFKLDGVEYKK